MKPQPLCAALALALALAGCGRSGDRDRHGDRAPAAAQVKQIEAEMLAAMKARDAAKVASYYADDAVLATPGRAAGRGRAAILAMLNEDLEDSTFDFDITNEKTAVEGNMAYTRGVFRVGYTDPATRKTQTATGSYVTVFERQDDGGWKVVEDISSPGAPAGLP
ncbi:MAG: YybH family protein [Allosphingosinicella sp.]